MVKGEEGGTVHVGQNLANVTSETLEILFLAMASRLKETHLWNPETPWQQRTKQLQTCGLTTGQRDL